MAQTAQPIHAPDAEEWWVSLCGTGLGRAGDDGVGTLGQFERCCIVKHYPVLRQTTARPSYASNYPRYRESPVQDSQQ